MATMLNPTAPTPPVLPLLPGKVYVPAFRGWEAPRRHPAWGLVVLALHLAVLAALMHAGWRAVQPAPPKALSLSLSLLPPAAVPQPAAALPQPAAVPRAPLAWQPLPVPSLVLSELPAATATPVGSNPVTLPAATTAPSPEASVARISPTPPAAAPKPVAAGSLRYRVEPAVEVPRLSRRAGEQGQVQLRVVFDTEGRPRDIQLARSSGFARLDAQAREAMQVARIAPYLEDGRPIEVVAVATLVYELD